MGMPVISPSVLSKVVKTITPKNERVEESQLRGTIVFSSGEYYIQLDGAPNDSLTPIANIEEGASDSGFVHGDRVLVLIKNHQAIVTKNLTTGLQAKAAKDASAFTTAITDEGITAQRIIANDTFTNTLRANDITADEIVAGMATIDSLDTTYAHITNGVIDNATIDQADVNNLEANYAHVTNGVIDNAKIGHADVNGLNANYAHITNGVIDNATIDQADVNNLEANYAHVTNGVIDTATIDQAKVNNLSANYAHTTNGIIDNATIDEADVNNLNANYAHVTNGVIDNAKIGHADVNGLNANYAHITNGAIDNAEIDYADVKDLNTHYAEIDLANVNNAWIQNGVIKDAAISDAQIIGVSANKLTAGTIDASNITVTNLNADNITAGTLNGQRIGTGSLSLDKLSEEVPTKDYVDDVAENLQGQIDGQIETWTGTAVPTLNNSPASTWTTADERHKHVGDIYYVVNAGATADGYTYRFTESGTTTKTYSWTLIKDNQITKALQDILDIQGDISDIQTFDTQISSWKTDTDSELSSLKSKTSTLETNLGNKVDTTTFNELSQTVDENSSSITSLSTTVSNKADSSTVTILSNTVNSVSQKASSNESKISNLTTVLGTNADGTTASTDIVHKVSDIDQDLDSITTRVATTEVQINGTYATSGTGSGTTAKVATITPAVTGWKLYTGATITVKFTNANTTASPTLNVNGTGAKGVRTFEGGTLAEADYKWAAGDTFTFIYNGTYWLMQEATTRLKTAEASITTNAGNITLKANADDVYSKTAANALLEVKANKDTLTSEINASADTVKINADRVNIEGAAIFSSIPTKADVVNDVVIEYGVGSSSTSYSDITSWTTTPTWTAGKYIWQRTTKKEYQYNSSTQTWTLQPTYTYSCIQGAKGDIGPQGVSVTNVTSTNNTADGGTSVVTVTLSNGTTKTFNVKNGNTGATGATAQWFYGTSLTHTSGTANLTVTGAVVGSMYLNTNTSKVYKCTAINGSTMTWTYAGDLTTGVIDNIQVGGTNLLQLTKSWQNGDRRGSWSVDSNDYLDFKVLSKTWTSGTIDGGTWIGLENNFHIEIKPNTDYTLSFWAKADADGRRLRHHFYPQLCATCKSSSGLTSTADDGNIESILTTSWERYWVTWHTKSSISGNHHIIVGRAYTTGTYYIAGAKLEKGNVATAWSPAPEDAVDKVVPIYKRTNSNSAPAAPTAIVTATTDQTTTGNWTKMHMSRIYSGNVAYKYLWTCNQLISVGGYLLGHTDVVADNGTTVINGDEITTGTISADRLNIAGTITAINNNSTTTINGGKITAGSLELGKLNTAAQDTISDAAKTATNYITYVNATDGIKVHNANDTSNYAQINSDGMQVVKSGVSVAEFGETSRIGNEDESYAQIDFHSFQLKDKEGRTYFWASDLRNEQGVATISEVATIVQTNNARIHAQPTEIVSVTINGVETTAYSWSSGMLVQLDSAPPSGAEVIVTYKTRSDEAKAFTLGWRKATSAEGLISFAFGKNVSAEGYLSHADGWGTVSRGNSSHAEGYQSEAIGHYSHAEGHGTHAVGESSHAEGSETYSNGIYSHSEGVSTQANGAYSHAEGAKTEATGFYSHAEGYCTKAIGQGSHASGMWTVANGEFQTVLGKYNDNSLTTAFEIGNGAGETSRQNIFTVGWNGKVNASGGYQVQGSPIIATKQFVASGVSSSTYYGSKNINIALEGYTPIAISLLSFNQALIHAYSVSLSNTACGIGFCKNTSSGSISSLNITVTIIYIRNECIASL